MRSDISIQRLKQFPPLMWILLFGSFITRGSFYMVWPFLAVILYEKFGLSATEVGLILSGSAVVSVVTTFIGSVLSDKFGRHLMMYGTGILYIISFALLAEANTIMSFIVVISLCSIATALWRPLTSALIGDIIKDSQTRELAMQAMYFIVNVGCAIGPIAGVFLGLTGEQSSFYITTYAFVLLLGLLFIGFRGQKRLEVADSIRNINNANVESAAGHASPDTSFKTTLSVLKQDKMFQCLILANVLCMFIYAQMDSSLVQYLTRAKVPNLLELISSIIFTNAIVIISCQFLLLKLMAKQSLVTRVKIGLLLLAASQFWIAFNPLTLFWGFIGATVVMSLAEAILFPTMNVHIDRIAPSHLRGAYFGAASIYDFGYALAPLGGGIILDLFGGFWLYIFVGVLTFGVIYLYHILETLPRPQFIAVKN
ncbi:MFS transporter [Psychrosphaera aestuarii]|uniref:MFS transporter n=1 Tax=Psychrosphaera aestuarii TaxID=1266052 RepID=UPI001B331066|nr:MFS transporter [Psychrosphaera aestuarii]